MISETTFARGYSSFWIEYFPWLNSYCQSIIKYSLVHIHHQVGDGDETEHRSINNTIAFFHFRNIKKDPLCDISKSKEQALRYLKSFPRNNVDTYMFSNIDQNIIKSQIDYMSLRYTHDLVINPFFPGCGIINNCYGDIIQLKTLTEVKAGDRNIVPSDLKQLITYCALNWISNYDKYDIEKIEIYNSRLGYSWECDLNSFLVSITDIPKEEVFDQLIKYLVTLSDEIEIRRNF